MKSKLRSGLLLACLVMGSLSMPVMTQASTDHTKPTIYGASSKTVYLGHSFSKLSGVTAKDNKDGNLTRYIKVSGSVNLKKTGVYKLVYTVSDKAKNKTTIKRYITVKKDTVKPKISGATSKTINIGSRFNALSGVTAKDSVDGILTKYIKVSGSVNTKKTGKYTLTYSVKDHTGNKAVVSRIITVRDNVKPVLSGIKPSRIKVGSTFNPLTGISATDNKDGRLTSKIKVSGSVNVKKVGTYTLTYSVTDRAGNTTIAKRTVVVVDTVAPVLSGVKEIHINLGTSFNPLTGVTASDNYDGNLTSNIKVSGSVNVNKAGSYSLTYSVKDAAGNKTTVKRIVKVVDTVAPVLSGVQDSTLNFGESFNPLDGITATDNNDGNLTPKIKVSGFVNVNKAGTYTLIYTVTDTSGNQSTASRKVTVVDNVNPVILGANNVTVGLNTFFDVLSGITATDNNDGDLTSNILVSGSVDTSTEGQYKVIYTVVDAAGNEVQVERVVTVKRIDVESVSISGPATVKTGQSIQLIAKILPTNATVKQVSWTSSDDNVATVDGNGLLTTNNEGTVTITATVDGVSTSKTITVSDRPNLYLYQSSSIVMNGLYKALGISMYNLESQESVTVLKVDVYQNNTLFASYSQQTLENAGINTMIAPSKSWGMSINFALGIRQNQSKIVVTVEVPDGKTYQYTLNV